MTPRTHDSDRVFMRRALALARRALGDTSPNPMVGAVVVRRGKTLAEGFHRKAGGPHAEIEALRACGLRGLDPRGATMYVTLEPCCTHGRTGPCTDALIQARLKRIVVAAVDPNPGHSGRGVELLRRAGLHVEVGLLSDESTQLNAGFNHWIRHHQPLVTLKAAMTLDGKIATASGESRWITNEKSRAHAMRIRQSHDAVLVGINTVLADDPALTIRRGARVRSPLRVVLDSRARTPLTARLVQDGFSARTVVVVGQDAPEQRVGELERQVTVWRAPMKRGRIDLRWVSRRLGQVGVTSLLVEGGGEVHASFLNGRQAHRVAFFYGSLVLGGSRSLPAVAGDGFQSLQQAPRLENVRVRRFDSDILIEADIRK